MSRTVTYRQNTPSPQTWTAAAVRGHLARPAGGVGDPRMGPRTAWGDNPRPQARRESCGGPSQAGTARHGTARRGAARHGTARHGTARHGAARHGTARHGTARRGAARHGTARRGAARHGTARRGAARRVATRSRRTSSRRRSRPGPGTWGTAGDALPAPGACWELQAAALGTVGVVGRSQRLASILTLWPETRNLLSELPLLSVRELEARAMHDGGPLGLAGLALLLTAAGAGARPRPAAPGHQPRSNVVLVACDSLFSHCAHQHTGHALMCFTLRSLGFSNSSNTPCGIKHKLRGVKLQDGRLTFLPGNQTVDLPSINFMKRHGTVFLNAYTNSPICCPSRAAMWSGLFTHITESWNNFKGLDPGYVTWMDLMEKHGYHTQKFGKLDFTSGHHSVSNRVEAWTRDVNFLLRQEGRPMVKVTGHRKQIRVMETDWQNTDKAVNWIKEEAVNFTQPFILYLGLNLPHPYPSPYAGENFGSSTFLTSPYWLEKVNYEAIKIPKWSSLSEMHPVDYYSSYTKNCTGEFTMEEVRNIRAFYYAMCAETDAMLGEIISALQNTGLLGKTIVIFTADHGELAMEHRQFYKMSMYEGSSHVPLLVMGPGLREQHQIPNVVSLVDIYPTMLDIARIPVPQNLSGYSLIPLLREKAENKVSPTGPRPSWVLSEFHGCNVNSSVYMLRIGKWKYITYSDGSSVLPQLFDLTADPDELTNLAIKFPVTVHSLDKILRSIVNYPKVSSSVQEYNKQQFISWKQSLGHNYSSVIANLRWHQDWLKDQKKYENAIEKWLGD
ncbi:arylsulfatase K isoform X4 [Taeniopygia guttata]|uniref:arylsulfatase K isoform X4 n=1 Tax=Taeniopygia guttata TaxID=59729 RepID=UPI003BB88218